MPRVVFLLILLLCTAPARAYISSPPEPNLDNHSLEALTAVSPLVLTATIDREYRRAIFDYIDLRPIDLLKAPRGFVRSQPLSAYFHPMNRPGGPLGGNPWPPVGTKILIFLKQIGYSAPEWEINDFVVLDPPASARSANSPLNYDLTLDPIPDAQRVWTIVQQEIRRTPLTTAVETYRNYPFHLQNLPADDRLLLAARHWALSADPFRPHTCRQCHGGSPRSAGHSSPYVVPPGSLFP